MEIQPDHDVPKVRAKPLSSREDRKRSIVFICPDYHCSFLYRDELRKRGWKADVYVPPYFPKELLYDRPDITCAVTPSTSVFSVLLLKFRIVKVFLKCLTHYHYHFYYGRLEHFTFLQTPLPLLRGRPVGFRLHLLITKLFGKKIIYFPSGTPDEVSIDLLKSLGNDEEGVAVEDELANRSHLKAVARYSDLNIGLGFVHTAEFRQIHLQYKSLDLDRWKPNIEIPKKYQMGPAPASTIRVLHSFMFREERQRAQGGDIKGTKYVIQAMERLKQEGYEVELMMYDKVNSRDYLYIQSQADVVVEELIRGCWGSTAVECLALGKPVLTYIRPEWQKNYLRTFSHIDELPIMNTNKHNIYENLKIIILDKELRKQLGTRARRFAEENFEVKRNVSNFENILRTFEQDIK